VIEKVGALVQAEDWVGQVWHRNNWITSLVLVSV
jgi:hypothetical protein